MCLTFVLLTNCFKNDKMYIDERKEAEVLNNRKFFKMFSIFTLGFLGLIALFLVFLIPFNGFNQQIESESLDIYDGGRKNVLVLGTDKSGLRADVIMIASFPDGKGTVNLTSIPRDAKIKTGSGSEKINSSLAIGGVDYTIRKVKEISGIKIHDFVKVNFNAVEEIVDKLGGIKFNVPQDMNYEDPYQDLSIHLKAGEQRLNGEKALQLLRFRNYPMADIQRTQVQRDFIKAAFDQKAKLIYIFRIPSIMNSISKNMETSISSADALSYVSMVKDKSSEGFQSVELPYTWGNTYVYMDPSVTSKVVSENFR